MRSRRWIAAMLLVAGTTAGARAADPDPYTLCLHVSITGASPTPHHQSRFGQFYFDMVNAEQGGIDGHPVRMLTYDDQYYPAGARRAVEECKRQNAQLYLGYLGIDQMRSVAVWANQEQVPYLHGAMPEAVLPEGDWHAMIGPTDEEQMRTHASILSASPPGTRVGMVHTDSPWHGAGRNAFDEALEDVGLDLDLAIPVQKDERRFSNVWLQLQMEQIDVVHLYISPLQAILMMRQRPLAYDPDLISNATEMGTDRVATSAPANARWRTLHDPGPVYDPDDQSLAWYDEMQEFLRVFTTYSPEHDPPPNDTDWTAYLRAKQVHRFLDTLDEDLSPETIRARFSTYAETAEAAFPGCALDFAPKPRFGQPDAHLFELVDGEWEQAARCVRAGGPTDLVAPTLACGPPIHVAGDRLVCEASDGGSGVGAWSVSAHGVATGSFVAHGDAGCAPSATIEADLPPGLWQATVTVGDCSILHRSARHTILAI